MATSPFLPRDACWTTNYGISIRQETKQLFYHGRPLIEAPKGSMAMADSHDRRILNWL